MSKSHCCFCGPVRNCGKYLDKVLSNIEKLGKLFADYKIIIFYDDSSDDSLKKLKAYQAKNSKLLFYVGSALVSPYRTHRLAHARNKCLDYVKQHKAIYDYFIMMDFDDPNAKKVSPNVLSSYLDRTDWDCLSFNTAPKYYDIWALSIFPYCFSYNNFANNNNNNYHAIQSYVMQRLKKLKPDELLKCISAFNGFAIYRTSKFMNCKYDGSVRFDLLPAKYLNYHSVIANSPLIYPDYGNVNSAYEDCEHRAFHVSAITKNEAKIMISAKCLFV